MAGGRNGYFQVNVASDGTYIHFFPAEGDGKPVDVKEMDAYLQTKCSPYDKRSVFLEAEKNKKPIITDGNGDIMETEYKEVAQ